MLPSHQSNQSIWLLTNNSIAPDTAARLKWYCRTESVYHPRVISSQFGQCFAHGAIFGRFDIKKFSCSNGDTM